MTLVLQVVHRVITRHLLGQAGLKPDEADSGAVTLIQRFGSAANLNIHRHCLVLDGVYRRSADGAPAFVEAPAPTDEALQAVLQKIIKRTMKLLTRRGGVGRRGGFDHHGRQRRRFGRGARTQAAASRRVTLQAAPGQWPGPSPGTNSPLDCLSPGSAYRIAFGPRAGQKVLTMQGAMPRDKDFKQTLCADIDGFSLHAAVRCGPMTGRRWSNCAATSRARRWPTGAYRPTSPDRWCSSSRQPGATAPRT